ncbi:MAG: hypothetical protein HY235_22570 [Acidobacteria bacterium]|nr:hypothetical protein [Acidobacteriota bacterium]
MAKIRFSRRGFLAASGAVLASKRLQADWAASQFAGPPRESWPSTYWVWLNGFTDSRRITYELEELKKAGVSAVYILEIGARAGDGVPAGPAFLSSGSLEAIGHAVREAGRLGIEVGITNASSWNAGGSWVGPEHASKGLYYSRLKVNGPTSFAEVLPFPKLPAPVPRKPDGSPAFYADIAVLAVSGKQRWPGFDFLFDLSPGIHTVDRVTLHNATAIREFAIFVSDTGTDGSDFREVFHGPAEARAGGQSFRIPAARARYLKLRLIPEPGEARRVELGEFEAFTPEGRNVVTLQAPDGRKTSGGLLRFTTEAGLEREWMAENVYDGRLSGPAGSWAAEGPAPAWVRSASDIIDLSDRLDSEGRLKWDVPAGEWAVYRFITANNGEKLKAPSPESGGFIIDHLSADAARMHTGYMLDRLRSELGDLGKTALKYFYSCSYEARGSIWTPNFQEEFRARRGYDPRRFLPVLAGVVVENEDVSERFRNDYRRTVSDLFVGGFYRSTRELASRHGLKLVAEAGGPGWPLHPVPVDALKAQGELDIPRGEFWKGRSIWVAKETASAAHIYGKRIVQMEAFTSFRHWQDGPRDLKRIADRAFCDGANHFVWHTMPHVPEQAGKPGWVYHAGTHFGPNETWWPMARPFLEYLARCSWLLRQGLFVADICHYYGERGFNFAPEKTAAAELGLPAGYDFDTTNSDVILTRMSVKEGRIVLPDGMSYALLVLPDRPDMDPEVLAKLEQLVRQGAAIVGPRPRRATGLRDYPQCDAKVGELSARLWGDCDGVHVRERAYGLGKICWGTPAGEILRRRSIPPDFSAGRADLGYIHRRDGDRDIYFVSNQSDEPVEADCVFRVKGRGAELWDPVDGAVRAVAVSDRKDGAAIRLALPPAGSMFVVFDRKSRPVSTAQKTEFLAAVEVSGSWDVAFAPGLGGPVSKTFPRLISWTEDGEFGVRHFSGIATYRKTVEIPSELFGSGRRLLLDLGDVRVIARVRVNGTEAGISWTPPFRLDITRALRPGVNSLEVEVANTWSNRLTGETINNGAKIARTNARWSKATPLLPSGLLGPVRIVPAWFTQTASGTSPRQSRR